MAVAARHADAAGDDTARTIRHEDDEQDLQDSFVEEKELGPTFLHGASESSPSLSSTTLVEAAVRAFPCRKFLAYFDRYY